VAGLDACTIRHMDSDWIRVWLKVQVGTGRFQVMACGAGIGNGVIVERGWGTASHIVYVMLVTMVMTMLLGRPKLSGALVGFLEASLGSTHGVVSGGLWLVIVCRVLACVAAV
jgi:hypothetical protein